MKMPTWSWKNNNSLHNVLRAISVMLPPNRDDEFVNFHKHPGAADQEVWTVKELFTK